MLSKVAKRNQHPPVGRYTTPTHPENGAPNHKQRLPLQASVHTRVTSYCKENDNLKVVYRES